MSSATSTTYIPDLPDYDGDELRRLGLPAERIDGRDMVTGKTCFLSDISLPEMAYGVLVRSPHGRACLTTIELTEAMESPGVLAVLSPADVEQYTELFGRPLLTGAPLYAGEPVAFIVADTPSAARRARESLSVTFETDTAVLGLAKSAAMEETCFASPVHYARGDVDKGLAEADVVHTATYRTAAVAAISPAMHGPTAQWDQGALTLWEATADLQQSRRRTAQLLDVPESNIRIIAPAQGGNNIPVAPGNTISALAALTSRQLQRPVQILMDLEEQTGAEFYTPPTELTLTIGARRDGALTAIRLEGATTCGAYETPVDDTLAAAVRLVYTCPHVATSVHTVLTNRPPVYQPQIGLHAAGAYALEHHLDQLARKLDVSPLDIRRRNSGDADPETGTPYSAGCIGNMIDKALQILDDQLPPIEHTPGDRVQKGRGWAVGVWPSCAQKAEARITLDKAGTLQVIAPLRTGGSGAATWIAQIVAEEFDVPPEDITVSTGDSISSMTGPPGATGLTVMSVGPAVRRAAVHLRTMITQHAAEMMSISAADTRISEHRVINRNNEEQSITFAELMEHIDITALTGDGIYAPTEPQAALRSFGLHCAEVSIDTWTGRITTDMYFALHDSGLIVNPLTARTVVETSVTEGIAQLCFRDAPMDVATGVPLGRTFQHVGAPVAPDLPNVDFAFSTDIDTVANNIAAKALHGASSLPVVPAIANAVLDATGIAVTVLPMLPGEFLNLHTEESSNA